MRAIFDSISDGVIVSDEDGNLTFNQSAERIVGGKIDTVLDQWTEEYRIFSPDKVTPIPTEELPLVRAMRGEATDEMDMFIRTAAKPEGVYISASGRPIASPGTNARGGVIVFRDVTERVRAEEALARHRRDLETSNRRLEASNRRLQAVLDATGDAIGMFDGGGRLRLANRGYEKLLDATEAELKRMSAGDLEARAMARLRPTVLPEPGGELFLDRTGVLEEEAAGSGVSNPRLFYRSTVPVHDGGGDLMGRVVIYRDVSREVESEQMKSEVQRLRAELGKTYAMEGMVGNGKSMQGLYALMRRAAESGITVLIQGESGTGKELVARLIHYNGPRKAGPFVAVNCAAIPENLIESELFGHERGAFTGASARRIGQFERAQGGTVLLDEIGDMPLALQAKLLRVLEEREFQRVGGTSTIPIDIRVIAATNRDLQTAVNEGGFRADLFYRLAAFPLLIPPLREHREDIPLLAAHFLKDHAERSGESILGISPAALQRLLAYDWPGNVRELRNAIERAALLENTDRLQVNNLPPQLASVVPAPRSPEAADHPPLSIQEAERLAIVRALECSRSNITRAARVLQIDRTTLHRKLKKYNLAPEK